MKAWPPPKSWVKVTEKFSLMRAKASSNFVREIVVDLLDGRLRVLDGVEQVLALRFEEAVALGGLVVLLERHHVDRAHRFEPLLQAAAGFFFGGQGFAFETRDVASVRGARRLRRRGR